MWTTPSLPRQPTWRWLTESHGSVLPPLGHWALTPPQNSFSRNMVERTSATFLNSMSHSHPCPPGLSCLSTPHCPWRKECLAHDQLFPWPPKGIPLTLDRVQVKGKLSWWFPFNNSSHLKFKDVYGAMKLLKFRWFCAGLVGAYIHFSGAGLCQLHLTTI
jgi:hypothetical protein